MELDRFSVLRPQQDALGREVPRLELMEADVARDHNDTAVLAKGERVRPVAGGEVDQKRLGPQNCGSPSGKVGACPSGETKLCALEREEKLEREWILPTEDEGERGEEEKGRMGQHGRDWFGLRGAS